jgi:cbb3-type cytochrome oxidase subunit 3
MLNLAMFALLSVLVVVYVLRRRNRVSDGV